MATKKTAKRKATRKSSASKRPRAKVSERDVDTMLRSYIRTALWSSMDESDERGGDPIDKNYGPSDVTVATKAKMRKDVKKFIKENDTDIDGDYDQAGHDFWLTRNRHGAGYWDGDWPEPAATRLTDSAHGFGEVHLYISRGKVHQY